MDTKTVLMLLAIAVSGNGVVQYWGQNESLNALCEADTSGNVYYSVNGPDPCDLSLFVMCYKGKAHATSTCHSDLRFRNDTQQCDLEANVPLPNGCSEDEETPQSIATSCDDPGTKSYPVESTCKKYNQCSNGVTYERDCNDLSYYIASLLKCVFIYDPFVNEIPSQELVECNAKDPYTDEDFEAAGIPTS